MKKSILLLSAFAILLTLSGCFGAKQASVAGRGGEVVGVSGRSFVEPAPYGMVKINRGFLKMGLETQDSLWGMKTPRKDVSVDGFWMDDTEITNSEYKQFVAYVRDSILRTRLADPAYGGDETYMITEDKNGDPVTPHVNWKKALPKKPNEDEQRAFESLYETNPVTGEKLIDWRQLNYKYEIYDYTAAAQRKFRLNPQERTFNTDVKINPDEVVMISKDTAYYDDEGRVVRETINRPLSGPWDFLNTYIVNVYPDTTCWVNDFKNAENETYLRSYFSNPAYNDYPVVGVTWEQANAFCAWRTDYLLKGLGPEARYVQRYRLPTEAEWEYAARGGTETPYFFTGNPKDFSDQGFWRKFFDAKTDSISSFVIYAKNSKNRTQEPGEVKANPFGLKNMLGNVMEYCADKYDPQAYSKGGESVTNPLITEGEEWVVRGGNYTSDAADVRSAARDYTKHDAWLKTDPQQPKSIWWYSDIRAIGFRVVCEYDDPAGTTELK